MKFHGYIRPIQDNSYTIPIYLEEDGSYHFHRLDEAFRIIAFENVLINHPSINQVPIASEYSIGDRGALVFVGTNNFFFGNAEDIIKELFDYVVGLEKNHSVIEETLAVYQSIFPLNETGVKSIFTSDLSSIPEPFLDIVSNISKLPGIGKKTALRLAIHLSKSPLKESMDLSNSIIDLRLRLKYCSTCNVPGYTSECTCKQENRDRTVICVVENTPDVLAINSSGQYNGLYHVLGGRISPIDGIGPEEININSLIKRIKENNGEVNEVILALGSTMEGDTTAFYITRLLNQFDIKITTIARGMPIGNELEYLDELHLGRVIKHRTEYQ